MQYAIVRTPANSKLERVTEMITPNLTKSKVCSRCRSEKPIAEFNRNRANKDGLQRNCKTCQSAATCKWQSENRDTANKIAKRYNDTRRKEYLAENPRFEGYYKQYVREWSINNNDKIKTYKRNRRARIRQVGGIFTDAEFAEVCGKYDYKCLSCKQEFPLEADHVVPLVSGGVNDISNIQPLCRKCNARKGRKTIDFRV